MRKAILTAAGAGLVFLAVACSNPVASALNASNWGLVGNWVNPAFVPFTYPYPYGAYLLTLSSDGTFRAIDSSAAYYETKGTYRVDEISASGSTRVYKVYFQYTNMAGYSYALVRITDGNAYQTNCNITGTSYPTAIDPTGMSYPYWSFSRQ